MSDGDALLKAVLEFPTEDTPRLVYADWLDENGEPERAAFIRVQVELARRDLGYALDTSMNHKVYEGSAIPEVRAAYHALRAFSARQVLEKRPELLPVDWCGSVVWRRGFLSEVTCSAVAWLSKGDAVLAAHPVSKVKLTTMPELDGFIHLPEVDGVELCKLKGRTIRLDWTMGESAASIRRRLLEAEWPGVTFELPRVSGPMANCGTWTAYAPA